MGFEGHEDLAAVAFLLGRWEGVGVTDFPHGEEIQFGQEVEFDHDGGPHLDYRSTMWRLDDDGRPASLLTAESGYWRALSEEERDRDPAEVAPHLEAVISHPEGFAELYHGTLMATRIELLSSAVMRSEAFHKVTSGHRLYGLVGESRSTLAYAWDLTAEGHTYQMSAQLNRPDAGA